MEFKKTLGIVLFILAVITFFLYILFPIINAGSKGVLLITISLYISNKIFFYSSLYILGKQFIGRFGKYLPGWMERRLLKILKIKTIPQIATSVSINN